MNWKDIEKEFRKKWTDVMQWSDDYGDREAYGSSAQQILAFFKPYFQEQMHDLSISDLEVVDNSKQ